MIIKRTTEKEEIIIWGYEPQYKQEAGITYTPIVKILIALIPFISMVALVPLVIFFITQEKEVLDFAIKYLILLMALINSLSPLLQLLFKKTPM